VETVRVGFPGQQPAAGRAQARQPPAASPAGQELAGTLATSTHLKIGLIYLFKK